MAACCLFGVCVPYTAILPFLIWLLQYLAAPLAKAGLLPVFISSRLGVNPKQSGSDNCCEGGVCSVDESSSNKIVEKSSTTDKDQTQIVYIKTMEQYKTVISTNKTVFVKFTAEWCKPCKTIHPFYSKLAAEYSSTKKKIVFAVIDVDELDDVAAECSVLAMPTFCAFRNEISIAKFTGSNEEKLDVWLKTHM